jgi:uncharacterized protein
MKSKNLIIISLLAFVATIVFYSLSGGESNEEYSKAVLKEREEKDVFMKDDEASPFRMNEPDSMKHEETFTALNYFPPDLKFKVNAHLEPIEDKKVVVLPTSDGNEEKYLEFAYAKFKLERSENKLLILEVMDTGPLRGKLFLAFADKTSSNETYGAGRYLDLKKIPGATSIVLDFNKAYNPYCAYTDNFSCPFPPKENILNIAIRAGEKNFH